MLSLLNCINVLTQGSYGAQDRMQHHNGVQLSSLLCRPVASGCPDGACFTNIKVVLLQLHFKMHEILLWLIIVSPSMHSTLHEEQHH